MKHKEVICGYQGSEMKRHLTAAKKSGWGWNYDLLKVSWAYQTRQFFEKSTLHGVRYIKEEGRPFFERFMWFCFTSVGTVATLIIIVSLWEKFQTNPTITGLDTDFHNWEVHFPAVFLCLQEPTNHTLVEQFVDTQWPALENETRQQYMELTIRLANMSYLNLEEFSKMVDLPGIPQDPQQLNAIQDKVVYQCEGLLVDCSFKGERIACCDWFKPINTEVGLCYSFNSRHGHTRNSSTSNLKFNILHIHETDEKWSLEFNVAPLNLGNKKDEEAPVMPIKVFILNYNEIPVIDVPPQHEWTRNINQISFSSKTTYTTSDARQLSIKQRRCVFEDELKLHTDTVYSYTACMSECRLEKAYKLCRCLPFFYPQSGTFKHCDLKGLTCLAKHVDDIKLGGKCYCELGCSNTVYEVVKLLSTRRDVKAPLEVGFVSWPMVRYKREVLFGWVDLLVSFGGIAGLFLGFSLLSGVEIIYYFTIRAFCMVYRDPGELRQLKTDYDNAERPFLDLSLTPGFQRGKIHPMVVRNANNTKIRRSMMNIQYLP